jgi:hypothetical protein
MKKIIIIEIICALFMLLFVYAAVTKLIDYEKFRVQIGQSPLLIAFADWIAWIVPAIELVIAVILGVPRIRLMGLYASFTLMIMFTAYIIMILNFADHVPCSCGGILEKMGWTEHLIFNIAFVLLALIAIVLNVNQEIEKSSKAALV